MSNNDNKSQNYYEIACALIQQIRSVKSQNKVSMKHPVQNLDIKGDVEYLLTVEDCIDDVMAAGNVQNVTYWLLDGDDCYKMSRKDFLEIVCSV